MQAAESAGEVPRFAGHDDLALVHRHGHRILPVPSIRHGMPHNSPSWHADFLCNRHPDNPGGMLSSADALHVAG